MTTKQACCQDWLACCPEKSAYQSFIPTIVASTTMAAGGMADAFLYAYLPVNAQALGLSAMAVGAILSINKFVRFFFNRWVNALVQPWGLRKILLVAILLSAATAFLYTISIPLWGWIFVRIVWGAAYTMFRFTAVQYSMVAPDKAHAISITTALRETGPIATYLIGPFILSAWGVGITFASTALLTLAYIPWIMNLPTMKTDIQEANSLQFQKASWLDGWVFISSFLADGLIIVALSVLMDFNSTTSLHGVLVTTALFISLKRIFQIVLAPLAGWLINQWDHKTIFLWSSVTFCLSVVMLTIEWAQVGILVMFAAAAINNVCLPLFALYASSSSENHNTFTKLSTAKDLGGALGALLGLELVLSVPNYLLFASLLAGSTFILIKTLKFVYTDATHQSHS